MNYRHQIASMHVKSYYNNDTTEIIFKKASKTTCRLKLNYLSKIFRLDDDVCVGRVVGRGGG